MMMIFVTGSTNASDGTVYFNISSADATSDSTSVASASLSASATSTASASTMSSILSPSTSAGASGLPSSSTASDDSSALPVSAKIGIGVGIPVAAIAGIFAGWLLFRRARPYKRPPQSIQTAADGSTGLDGSTLASPKHGYGVPSYGPVSSTTSQWGTSVHEAGHEMSAPSELYGSSARHY